MLRKITKLSALFIIIFLITACKLVEVVPTVNAPEIKDNQKIAQFKIKEIVKIGTISPLGKETDFLGKSLVNAIEMAIEDFNQDPEMSVEILMVHEDGQCDENSSSEKAQELIEKHKVQAIIGGLCSQETKGISKIATENKVPFLSLYSLSSDRANLSLNTYHLTPSDKAQGEKAAEFSFTDLHQKKIVIISEDSNYGQNLKNAFNSKFLALGGKIDDILMFERDKKDFSKIFEFLKTITFDGLYVIAMPEDAKLLFKELESLEKPLTIIGADTLQSDVFIKNYSFKNLRLILLALEKNESNDWQEFHYQYQLKYGKEPTFGAPEGYDAIKIILQVIQKNGYDKTMINQGLQTLDQYNGISGKIKFENQENILRNWDILELDQSQKLSKLK